MESSEQHTIRLAAKKLAHWYRYINETFVLWTHGKEDLQCFLQLLNSIHPSIKLSRKVKQNTVLPFLDVMVRKNQMAH
jgi:hypothetical protein